MCRSEAHSVSSLRFDSCSLRKTELTLRKTELTCVSTVLMEMNSSYAYSLYV